MVTDAYITFLTPTTAAQNGFGMLFDASDNNDIHYAIAIATNGGGSGVKAALVEVDRDKYDADLDYRAQQLAKARSLFNLPNAQ